jgi:hypothetical protein
MNPQKINYFVAYEYPKNEKFYAEVKSVEVINFTWKKLLSETFYKLEKGANSTFFLGTFFLATFSHFSQRF